MKMQKILHILSNKEQLDKYIKDNPYKSATFIAFDEAMCYGNVTENIFKKDFVKERCKSLNITLVSYKERVLNSLNTLFQDEYDLIALHFESDMFSLINLLTILAYIDYWEYPGEVILIGRENKNELVDFRGYYDVYKDVLIKKENTSMNVNYNMKKAIKKYLEYLSPTYKIKKYILLNLNKDEDTIIKELSKLYFEYGITKEIYHLIINDVKYDYNRLKPKTLEG